MLERWLLTAATKRLDNGEHRLPGSTNGAGRMATTFDNPSGVAAPIGTYSHVARIELGQVALLFISGQVSLGPDGQMVGAGNAAAQGEQIFENLKRIMEANGGGLGDIVKLTTYLTDINDRPQLAEVRARYIGNPAPTSTLVAVSALASPQYLVEIEAVAVVASGA
jgi:2-iminobutanoate/2-iminopropanoate deaminase